MLPAWRVTPGFKARPEAKPQSAATAAVHGGSGVSMSTNDKSTTRISDSVRTGRDTCREQTSRRGGTADTADLPSRDVNALTSLTIGESRRTAFEARRSIGKSLCLPLGKGEGSLSSSSAPLSPPLTPARTPEQQRRNKSLSACPRGSGEGAPALLEDRKDTRTASSKKSLTACPSGRGEGGLPPAPPEDRKDARTAASKKRAFLPAHAGEVKGGPRH